MFCNSRRDKIKVLEWDGNGFWLYQKRLEKGTFPWPKESSRNCKTLISLDIFVFLVYDFPMKNTPSKREELQNNNTPYYG